MIVNGEVAMGMIWQNRGKTIEERTNGRYKLVMNEAIAMPGAYIVPARQPRRPRQRDGFTAQALQVESQLMILDCLGMTPSNPEAFAKIPEAMQPNAVNSAQNIDKVIFNDPVWWADNGGDAVNAFPDTPSADPRSSGARPRQCVGARPSSPRQRHDRAQPTLQSRLAPGGTRRAAGAGALRGAHRQRAAAERDRSRSPASATMPRSSRATRSRASCGAPCRLCLITTVAAVTLGYIVFLHAMLHALAGVRRRMMSILLISFWISVLVRSFAWLMPLGHNGLVNDALMGLGLISEPLPLMRNELGVLIGMTEDMLPYAILPLLANMQGIDPRVSSASRSLGVPATPRPSSASSCR